MYNNKDYDSAFLQYASIINTYRTYKGVDKKTISNILGISLPTVYNAINNLKNIGILRDTQRPAVNNVHGTTSTRTENLVALVPDFAFCASVSIGASLCKFVILDLDFEMMRHDDFKYHKEVIISELRNCLSETALLDECSKESSRNYIYFNTPSTFLELKRALDIIFAHLMKTIEDSSKEFRLLSIGITSTGMVNENEKIVRSASNLKYIENTTLDNFFFPDKLNYFRENGISLELIQNSNAAVIAEKYTLSKSPNSSIRDKKNVVAIYLGVGLGAGLYFDQLYSGASGYCGEVGHLPAPNHETELENNEICNKSDPYCACGSSNCFDFKIRKYVFNEKAEDFKEYSSDKIKTFLESNPAKAALFGKYLGSIVNLLTTILDIDIIVFTGKLYKSMDLLYNSIAEIQDESTIKFSRNDCMLLTSKYGASAPAVGAAIYSYYKKYNLKLKW